ncbi:MAG TPA: phosphoribosylamine--glycine ligase [bacterium]|nr:phosphoribosylamine--glycine ligase [bacterium]
MRVLLVGSGGREHAIAMKLAESASVDRLVVAPGNGGTAAQGWNIAIGATDIDAIVDFADKESIDMVVIGPEAPLALGLADALAERSTKTGRRILCFGPGREAARLESSKAFSKAMMSRLGIPTAAYHSFAGAEDFERAADFVREAPWPVVVKGSGLASGKGVFLPESTPEAIGLIHELLRGSMLGEAGSELVIEERLEGEELSILAFCDGTRIAVMPSAQDHKRLLDGDRGPNTGGMGAYAPAPGCPPELALEYARIAIEPVVHDLATRGTPFIGVVYAGIIVTAQGPKVLEYNCRFGDPEAQAILALFDGDLAATLAACASGDMRSVLPAWKSGAAACVVMASEGYPDAAVGGAQLAGLEPAGHAYVLHANTRRDDGTLVALPGRVLGVTAVGQDLREALSSAYAKVDAISFPGARFRRDIGVRGLARLARDGKQSAGSAYASSGVDIDAGNEAVRRMAGAVKATYTDAVLAGIGSFGGLWDAASLAGMVAPVLVGSTDGVGTKVKLAAQAGSYRSIGMDIVNHCIDDILVQGARPLFFLDYFASSRIDPAQVAEAVGGMAAACQSSGCVLLGGETAEMPGVYQPGEFDIAGTIVGVVERASILPTAGIEAGDVLVGFRSDGPHTNGYSLVRRVFDGVDLSTVYPELGAPLGQVLLAPHRSYLPLLWPILRDRPGLIKGLAHLTGGGFVENVPRILPAGIEAVIERGRWPVPPLYRLIERLGRIDADEMYRVFNMGIGMVAVVERGRADELVAAAGEECWIVGQLAATGTAEGARTRLA